MTRYHRVRSLIRQGAANSERESSFVLAATSGKWIRRFDSGGEESHVDGRVDGGGSEVKKEKEVC